MKNQITIREAVTENDAAAFWEQLHAYHKRDIFMDSDKEELEYFLGQAYRDHMMNIYGRPQDRCFFLFFHRGGQDIGFAMPVIFNTEDGKCFIMDSASTRSSGAAAREKRVQQRFWAGQKNTARVMQS